MLLESLTVGWDWNAVRRWALREHFPGGGLEVHGRSSDRSQSQSWVELLAGTVWGVT